MISLKETIRRFDNAVHILAGTDARLKERLEGAIGEISTLQEKDFNPDLRKTFRKVSERMHAYSLSRDIPERQAELADSIVEMCITLHRWTME